MTVGFLVACAAGSAPSRAETVQSLLTRALTCELHDDELAGFQLALAKADQAFTGPVKRYYAPSFNQYRVAAPVTAYGLSTTDILLTRAAS